MSVKVWCSRVWEEVSYHLEGVATVQASGTLMGVVLLVSLEKWSPFQ